MRAWHTVTIQMVELSWWLLTITTESSGPLELVAVFTDYGLISPGEGFSAEALADNRLIAFVVRYCSMHCSWRVSSSHLLKPGQEKKTGEMSWPFKSTRCSCSVPSTHIVTYNSL